MTHDAAGDDDERRFVNHYTCPTCGAYWMDQWSAQCDDDCPACGLRSVSPVRSDDLSVQVDQKPRA